MSHSPVLLFRRRPDFSGAVRKLWRGKRIIAKVDKCQGVEGEGKPNLEVVDDLLHRDDGSLDRGQAEGRDQQQACHLVL